MNNNLKYISHYNYIDTHTHLHDTAFDSDRDMVVTSMQEQDIAAITIGTDLVESKKARDIANKYENIYFTIGVHPCDDTHAVFDERDFVELVTDPKCVAVGECGLDYYWLAKNLKDGNIENIEDEKGRQKNLFRQQIEFAVRHNKPLMLHGRPSPKSDENSNGMDAYIDMITILREVKERYAEEDANMVRGNVHFFVGDRTIAQEFLDLGFDFSLGGVLTLTNEYDDVVKFLPIGSVHAETDSPYVSPRVDGKKVSQRNSSEYVPIIVKKIAELKDVELETFRKQLLKNVRKLYFVE